MTELEKLQNFVSQATKLYRIDNTSDTLVVEVIRGMNPDPNNCNVLVDRIKIPRGEDLVAFLSSKEVQDKLLAPRDRGILLVDLSRYSKFDTLGQAALLSLLKETIESWLFAQTIFSPRPVIEQIVPTGDGCYVIFHESINDRFARAVCGIKAELHCRQVRLLSQIGVPSDDLLVQVVMACHLGNVDFFTDSAGHRNCFGTGMNEAARILELGKKAAKETFPDLSLDGTVFVSATTVNQARQIELFMNRSGISPRITISDLGKQLDKHEIEHHIYWIQGLSNHVAILFYSVVKGVDS